MDAFDISRIPGSSQKQHYTGVRMQQGRVILDQDWNESEQIDNEDTYRSRIDVIGPFGSPDDGFRIENLRTDDGRIDFDIHDGTLYLGGLRLEMEPAETDAGPVPETYRTQKDWLQQAQGDHHPVPELGPGEERFDLVFLEAWRQAVSAVEDSELFEPALGGPDTTTRLRNMRRVRIASGTGFGECAEAWAALIQAGQAAGLGVINADHELKPDTRLFVDYIELDDPDDLCAPDAVGGYLGAENQAIRVQLREKGKLIWGYDNAAPLYRVQVSGDTVHFLTEPKDQHHWPLAGQIVEILPWSAVLANGEKVASLQGHLSRVKTSYDPDPADSDQPKLTLSDPLPTGFFGDHWEMRPDSDALRNQEPAEYYYLRLWRGIPDDQPMELDYTFGTPVTLGHTGIRVTIFGNDHNPGDHWILAARPETPRQVLPWELEADGGMAPHGVRRFYAPLAIIRWRSVDGAIQGKIIRDCRKTFRPLTDLETCCTFHVGDGVRSFGDFNSLEAAVQNLPEAGGRICLLPGRHQANVALLDRQNIRITGCGAQSIVLPREGQPATPVFRIANCRNITLDNLSLVAPQGTGVLLFDRTGDPAPSSDITIRDNKILAGEYALYLEVDDVVRGENNIHIVCNQIAMVDNDNGKVAVFCLADQVLIERNKIVVVPPPAPDDPGDPRNEDEPEGGVFDPCDDGKGIFQGNFNLNLYVANFFKYVELVDAPSPEVTYRTFGGIQIGGGAENVEINDNKIIGGRGNGITLGHFPTLDRLDDQQIDEALKEEWANLKQQAAAESYYFKNDYSANTQRLLALDFRSFLYEITIEENLIRDMGLSGIGVIAFFDPGSKDDGLVVHIENLTVYRNDIFRCAQQVPQEIPDAFGEGVGFGGIALSSVENARIEENRIEDNGLSFVDPICGIYLYNGEDVEISRNRILNNGPRESLFGENFGLSAQARRGARGGIYIGMVLKRQFVEAIREELLSDGVPAAKIHDNIVVQPLGQALFVIAFGPVTVVSNQLTSHEIDFGHPLSLIAGAVFILNTGISKDMMRYTIEPRLRRLACQKEREETNPAIIALFQAMLLFMQYLPSGNTLVANNQIVLDLRNLELDLSLSATAVFSFDDIGFVGNQCECKGLAFYNPNAESPDVTPFVPIDIVLFNTFLAAFTVRSNNNRFQEGFTFVPISLLSVGKFNTTIGNQASNCIFTFGSRNVDSGNIEQMLQPFLPLPDQFCGLEREEFGREAGISCPEDDPDRPKDYVNYISDNQLVVVRNTNG